MKLLKIISSLFVLVILLTTGAALFLPSLLDLSTYKTQIEQQLKDQTGLEWSIDGPIQLALIPQAKLSLSSISVEDKGEAKITALKNQKFSFQEAGTTISWFPHVINKKIVVKSFSLNQLDYSKQGQNLNTLKLHLEELTVGGLEVNFAGQVPIIEPQNSEKTLPIALKIQTETLDKSGASLNRAAIDLKAEADLPVNGGKTIPALKNMNADIRLNLPNLKEDGLHIKVQSDINVTQGLKELSISNLELTAAKQVFKGSASVNMANPQPNISFNIIGNDINTDAFLDLLHEKEANETETQKSESPKTEKKTIKPLPQIGLDGTLSLTNITYNDFIVDQLNATIKASNGVYNISPATVKLYDGTILSNIKVKGTNLPVECALDTQIDAINISSVLKTAIQEDPFTGAFSGAGKINLPCLSGPIDLNKATGSFNTEITDGVIQKWQVSKGLNQALSVAKAIEDGGLKNINSIQQALNVTQGDDRFEFTAITAESVLSNGIFENKSFKMSAPFSEVNGSGQIDLNNSRIDYGLKLNLSKSKDNNKYYIPIRITGALSEPSYSIDTESLLKSQVKDKIKEKVQEELKDKIGSEILKVLPF